MSDLMATTAAPANDPVAELRAKLIGSKVPIEDAAAAFDVTVRAIYLAIARHRIPYTKIFNVRYLEPDDLRRALVSEQNTQRRRGRPRKTTA